MPSFARSNGIYFDDKDNSGYLYYRMEIDNGAKLQDDGDGNLCIVYPEKPSEDTGTVLNSPIDVLSKFIEVFKKKT